MTPIRQQLGRSKRVFEIYFYRETRDKSEYRCFPPNLIKTSRECIGIKYRLSRYRNRELPGIAAGEIKIGWGEMQEYGNIMGHYQR